MEENLIIPENYPELVQQFMGQELYLIEETKWYKEIKSEGGNRYRFLNVVSVPGTDIIPPQDRDFFFRVISAVKTEKFTMDADGIAFVNIHEYKGITWENLKEKFSPKYCIFWGTDPHKLGISCRLYGGTISDTCKILYVDALDTIVADPEKKKLLWNRIQRMFGMSTT